MLRERVSSSSRAGTDMTPRSKGLPIRATVASA
jgi:hypothetical protein